MTRTGTIFETADEGETWQAKSVLPESDAVEMVVASSGLYVLAESGDVWRRTGSSPWLPVGTVSQVHMCGLSIDDAGGVVAAITEGEVAVSTDGAGWTWIGAVNQLNVVALATDFTPPIGVRPLTRARLKERYRK